MNMINGKNDSLIGWIWFMLKMTAWLIDWIWVMLKIIRLTGMLRISSMVLLIEGKLVIEQNDWYWFQDLFEPSMFAHV